MEFELTGSPWRLHSHGMNFTPPALACIVLGLLVSGCATVSSEKSSNTKSGVQITELPDKLRVEITNSVAGANQFAEYLVSGPANAVGASK